MNNAYKRAGVDVTAGYKAVDLIKSQIGKTFDNNIGGSPVGSLGGFGGMYQPNLAGISEPILVSGTDGVGTKLKLAFLMDKHNTIGIDCVAMCVNDVICAGARPLFFLDYVACGKNNPEKISEIVSGVVEGCVQSGAALVGGETAEMPGFYPIDEYDLAGFTVGIVDKSKIPDISKIQENDVIIGLASSGCHSNGYSLVRKVFALDDEVQAKKRLTEKITENLTLGDALLCPTKIYVKSVLGILDKFSSEYPNFRGDYRPPIGISHITGGGFYENIPRSLPVGLAAEINMGSWNVPEIYDLLAKEGKLDENDLYNTFNMGVGVMLSMPEEFSKVALDFLNANNENASIIGKVVKQQKSDDGRVYLLK